MPKNQRSRGRSAPPSPDQTASQVEENYSELDTIPSTYQGLTDYLGTFKEVRPHLLRLETYHRIERITNRPLICYITKTHHLSIPSELSSMVTPYIEDSDLTGFNDLIMSTDGDSVDVLLVSNGGSAETTERIVRMLREKFEHVRFIVPGNAFSAATMMCFSGNEIVMSRSASLGPIDPQINGIPTRSILRAFESIEQQLKEEGPAAITAYLPLIEKYDLHILEICKSVEALSKELAITWLSKYMFNCDLDDTRVANIVNYFSSYDVNKSHSRSIVRQQARELGLNVVNVEAIEGLEPLVQSLFNQFQIWFENTRFYKMYENSKGINWGYQILSAQPTGQFKLVPNS